MAVDASGTPYIAGVTVDAATDHENLVLAEYNLSGELLSKLEFSMDSSSLLIAALKIDAEHNFYIAGASWSKDYRIGFVQALDEAGQSLWHRTGGTTISSVAVDVDRNLYYAGEDLSYTENAAGNRVARSDLIVRRCDSKGESTWPGIVSVDANKPYAFGIAADDVGNSYLVTTSLRTGVRAYDAVLAKLGEDSELLWSKQLDGKVDGIPESIARGSGGSLYVAGHFLLAEGDTSGPDAFVSQFNSDGDAQWQHTFVTQDPDANLSIALDGEDNVYVAGHTVVAPCGGTTDVRDAFVRKYGVSGELAWEERLGTPKEDSISSLAVDASGNVYVLGNTFGSFEDVAATSAKKAFFMQIPAH